MVKVSHSNTKHVLYDVHYLLNLYRIAVLAIDKTITVLHFLLIQSNGYNNDHLLGLIRGHYDRRIRGHFDTLLCLSS